MYFSSEEQEQCGEKQPRAEGTQGLTVAGTRGREESRSSSVTKAIKTRFHKTRGKERKITNRK